MIPYGRQIISEQDVDAVVDVLRSDFFNTRTQGQRIRRCLLQSTWRESGCRYEQRNIGTSRRLFGTRSGGVETGYGHHPIRLSPPQTAQCIAVRKSIL